jgi:hypothetical protein
MPRFLPAVLILSLSYALMTGCSSKPAEKLVPVEGKVTFDGKPLTTGTVIFHPDSSRGNNSQEEPRGKVEADGSFKVSTRKGSPGAAPGWYKIAIIAQKKTDPKDPYSIAWITPQRLADPEKSGMALEVTETPAADAYHITAKTK